MRRGPSRDPADQRGQHTGTSLLHPGPDVVPLKKDWVARTVLLLALALLALSAFGVWLRFRPVPYETSRWLRSSSFDRGRMLSSLLGQTDFVGFPRVDVEHYIGPADYDERQIWYDLGPADTGATREARAAVGDPSRLYAVFRHDPVGGVIELNYSYRRPTLGSAPFDSTVWFGEDRAARRSMFTRTLARLRGMGFSVDAIESLLGPPDGARVRGHYQVGLGGALIGSQKALVLDYDASDRVVTSAVID
jgi:hypothetical protein